MRRIPCAGQGETLDRLSDSLIGREGDGASFLDAGIPDLFVHRLADPRCDTAEVGTELFGSIALSDAGSLVPGLLGAIGAR